MPRLLAICTLAFALAAPAWADRYAIVGANLFDGRGTPPYVATVTVKDGVIERVAPGRRAPFGVKRIEARGLALLPGLFDVHTHYTPNSNPGAAPQISAAYVAVGVTTVNDFHQPPESFAARRAWYPDFPGPRVNLTARLSTPGGHGADWADEATTRWVNTPEAARSAIEELAHYAPDFIKVFTDGWRYGASVDNTSMNEPTLTALVEAAHAKGLRVGTHTVTAARGKIAARAGVDIIVHSLQDTAVDAELIALMRAKKVAYAPTLAVYEPQKPGQPPSPAATLAGRRERFATALANVRSLHAAGIPIVLGTDAGIPGTPHGVSALRELELLVEAGLSPTEALIAGTRNAATAMGAMDRGTIAAGQRADLVLVRGEPWVSISDMRKTVRTFVDGRTVFGPGAPEPYAGVTPPAVAPPANGLIADFERQDGRTNVGALPVTNPDGGVDRSVVILSIETAPDGGRYLAAASRFAVKAEAVSEVVLPLVPGGVAPMDVGRFQGLAFDVRGQGEHRIMLDAASSSDLEHGFIAQPQWRSVTVSFADLRASSSNENEVGPAPQTDAQSMTDDLLAIRFVTRRPGGETAWLEIDNVRFY